jgi:hypothetical protein
MSTVHLGAAPVGRLTELPPLERQVIRYLRLWSAGADGQELAMQEFDAKHGRAAARLVARFGELVLLTVRHARRPLRGQAPGCLCAAGEKCVFARFVALAAEGAREEAILMAALMVRADLALELTALAEEIGLGLMRGPKPRILQ